jgi:hypothetical protein
MIYRVLDPDSGIELPLDSADPVGNARHFGARWRNGVLDLLPQTHITPRRNTTPCSGER